MQENSLISNPCKLHTFRRFGLSFISIWVSVLGYAQVAQPSGFIPNVGQFSVTSDASDKQIHALYSVENAQIWITGSGIELFYPADAGFEQSAGKLDHISVSPLHASILSKNIHYSSPVNGKSYYYRAGSDLPIVNQNYQSIQIDQIYPGINWIIETDQKGVKFSFEVAPGVNPNCIQLNYTAPGGIHLQQDGSLLIPTAQGDVIEPKPYCYTSSNQYVESAYQIIESNQNNVTIGYELQPYNDQDTLIIDPALWWCTFYGGSQNEEFTHITSDLNGNVIAVGFAESTNFPTYNAGTYYQPGNSGNEDAVIVKFSPTGVRLWSTYYGGDDEDFAFGVTTDASGNIFVTGETVSPNFPVYNAGTFYQGTLNGDEDVFILKFNSSGTRLWATYYGGDNKEGGHAIVADATGNIFVTGYTKSSNFPKLNAGTFYQATLGGVQDAFMLKFNNSGTRIWASYYGGNAFDEGNALAVDSDNELFVTGTTKSTNFPVFDAGTFYQGTMAGDTDAYAIKFTNTGTRLWATYLGGTDADYGQSVICNQTDDVFFSGYSRSTDLYTYTPDFDRYYQSANAGGTDIFLFEATNSGDCAWSTFFGGSANEYMDSRDALAVDACNNLYLTQTSWSADLPVYDAGCTSYYDATNAGEGDIFLTRFTTSFVISWATYYGFENEDILSCLESSAFEQNTLFLTGVYHEYDPGEAVPLANPGGSTYYDGSHNGDDEPFIAKFNPVPLNLDLTYSNLCYCLDSATVTPSCGVAPYSYLWTDGQTDSIATDLCAGYWEVIVSDADCNVDTLGFIIDCILPLEILEFTGSNANGINTLIWEVPEIHQCSNYVLSRIEPTAIIPIYQSEASTQTLYTVTDQQYADTVMYYMLTGYDLSGIVLFNQTLALEPMTQANSLTITYPEYEKAALHLNSRSSEEIQVVICDMTGKQVMSTKWSLDAGANTLYFEHPYLPKGNFIVSVNGRFTHASTFFHHQ